MSVWLLIVTVTFTGQPMTLDLPADTIYLSADRCEIAGKFIADTLAQEWTDVRWKCVEVPR